MGEGREGSTAHAHGIQAAELVPQEQRPQHPTARAPQGQSTASSQGGAAAVEGHSTSSVSAGQNGLWLAFCACQGHGESQEGRSMEQVFLVGP